MLLWRPSPLINSLHTCSLAGIQCHGNPPLDTTVMETSINGARVPQHCCSATHQV
jgi:hypothetical protein